MSKVLLACLVILGLSGGTLVAQENVPTGDLLRSSQTKKAIVPADLPRENDFSDLPFGGFPLGTDPREQQYSNEKVHTPGRSPAQGRDHDGPGRDGPGPRGGDHDGRGRDGGSNGPGPRGGDHDGRGRDGWSNGPGPRGGDHDGRGRDGWPHSPGPREKARSGLGVPPPVDPHKQKYPHDIHKMPIPGSSLKPQVLPGGKPSR